MNCPSCQSKAKEQGPDQILCSTCGPLVRVDGEWVPGEKIADQPAPVKEPPVDEPKPVQTEEPPPKVEKKTESVPVGDRDEDWLTELKFGGGGGSDESKD